jgi:hypothetical protein
MSSDRVRAALRGAAAAHRPDRDAILARIELGRAGLDAPRPPRPGHRGTAVRAAGIVATVAAVLGFGVAVTWAAVGTDVLRRPAQGQPTLAPAPPAESPGRGPGPAAPSRPRSTSHPSGSPVVTAPSATRGQQGFLRSSGVIDSHSIDNWTQSNVTVETGETLTALDVSVRIAVTPDLSSTGAWSTVLARDLVTTVERQPDALVYRFTLKPGIRLGPGSHVFAVQYNHAVGGRDRSRDTYHAMAIANGTRAEVGGGF